MANPRKQLALAAEQMRLGNLARARSLYRRILDQDAACAEAWHQLGAVAARSGDGAMAAVHIRRAIQLGGPQPPWCNSLGQVFAALGRHQEAAACFRQAIAGDPLNGGFSLELGKALLAAGASGESIPALTQAVELDCSNPEAWFHLGYAFYQSSDIDRAAACYERASALNPQHAQTHFRLGVVRMRSNRSEDAIALFRRTIELDPRHAEAYNNLGLLEQDGGKPEAAVECFDQALRLRSGKYYAAKYNRARALGVLEDPQLACEAYHDAVLESPEHVDARLGMAESLTKLGRPDEALCHLLAAVELSPDSVAANLDLSITLLQLGRWTEAWPLYEWRLRQPGVDRRTFEKPMWTGAPLRGERVLLRSEQGFGDTLQMARYVPLVRRRGGTPILECQPPLARLMRTLDGVEEVIAEGEPLPAFDYQTPLMSLPGIFATQPDTVPSATPYLLAAPDEVSAWSDRLAAKTPGLRVGLTWQGNPLNPYERNRAIPIEMLRALSALDGVTFFNLQKGFHLQEHAGVSSVPKLLPMIEECDNFAENAAAMMNLDLVISVDTAMAHLAGALGRPVWTLLPYASDWRWLRDRGDTPWYPTMRLFRQTQRGDWDSVLGPVRQELVRLIAERRV